MNTVWPRVRLGDVLRFTPRPLTVEAARTYREIGIRSHGRGIFHKPPVTGLEIGHKKVFYIEPDDFVLNIVFAWEGAIAVTSDAEAGMIASHRFPTFRPDPTRLEIKYLQYWCQTELGRSLLDRVSPGGAGRNRTLNRDAFLNRDVPLPPVAEQRRVVKRIRELFARIHEAHNLCQQAAEEAGGLLRSALARLTQKAKPTGALGSVLAGPPRNGWSAKCDNAEGGTPVLSLGAVTRFRYRSTEFKRTSLHAPEQGHFWLRPGDLLITRSKTPELVGHAAFYDGNPRPCIYPDLMMRLEIKSHAVERRFVWYWLQSQPAREFLSRNAKGTSPTMKKISQGTVLAIPFPSSLPLADQCRIVAELDALQTEVDVLKRLQVHTAAELDALPPAVLERAFEGEL